MADRLIKRFEERINSKFFKPNFMEILKRNGLYYNFQGEWVYHLSLSRQQVENILQYPLSGSDSHLLIVGLQNGTLKLRSVA